MTPSLDKIISAFKYETIIRQIYARAFSGTIPFYIVNEFPRSGGTWISTMLGEALDIPFPRRRPPNFTPSILQAHHISPFGLRNVVPVFRDGRDVMASWYHYCFFENEHEGILLVNSVGKYLAFNEREDIVSNLPKFLEWAFENNRHPGFSWSEFVDVWHGRLGTVPVKYEDFRQNGVATLTDTIFKLTHKNLDLVKAQQVIDNNSFANKSGRKAGEENKTSLMRKGIIGDWESSFNAESREIFNHYAGAQLIKLGYEKDQSWTSTTQSN